MSTGYRLAEPRFTIETAGGEVLARLYHFSNAVAEANALSRKLAGRWLIIRRTADGTVVSPDLLTGEIL